LRGSTPITDDLIAAPVGNSTPELPQYQSWSDQLHNYARNAATPEVSRHLHRIAELSTQAVAQVGAIRGDPPAGPSNDAVVRHRADYQRTIVGLLDEVKAAQAVCR
jgi:hypothetical protein